MKLIVSSLLSLVSSALFLVSLWRDWPDHQQILLGIVTIWTVMDYRFNVLTEKLTAKSEAEVKLHYNINSEALKQL